MLPGSPYTTDSHSTASAWLRATTRPEHERAEAVVLGRLQSDEPRALPRYLYRLLGLYAPLEEALQASAAYLATVPEPGLRRKVDWLREDLAFFGVSLAELANVPRCDVLPSLRGAQRTLGVAYVLEGATLGGAVLLRHLRARLPLEKGRGASFLVGYGASTGRLWDSFRRALDEAVTSREDWDELREGAAETFRAFELWLREDVAS